MGSYYTNEGGGQGTDGIWRFGTGLSGEAVASIEMGVLSKVSFLIPAIGSTWP